MDDSIDIRTEPYVVITDTYTKGGKHLKSVCKTQDGRIVWEEERIPGRDVSLFYPDLNWPWKKDV
jgi:hypothetical protein